MLQYVQLIWDLGIGNKLFIEAFVTAVAQKNQRPVLG